MMSRTLLLLLLWTAHSFQPKHPVHRLSSTPRRQDIDVPSSTLAGVSLALNLKKEKVEDGVVENPLDLEKIYNEAVKEAKAELEQELAQVNEAIMEAAAELEQKRPQENKSETLNIQTAASTESLDSSAANELLNNESERTVVNGEPEQHKVNVRDYPPDMVKVFNEAVILAAAELERELAQVNEALLEAAVELDKTLLVQAAASTELNSGAAEELLKNETEAQVKTGLMKAETPVAEQALAQDDETKTLNVEAETSTEADNLSTDPVKEVPKHEPAIDVKAGPAKVETPVAKQELAQEEDDKTLKMQGATSTVPDNEPTKQGLENLPETQVKAEPLKAKPVEAESPVAEQELTQDDKAETLNMQADTLTEPDYLSTYNETKGLSSENEPEAEIKADTPAVEASLKQDDGVEMKKVVQVRNGVPIPAPVENDENIDDKANNQASTDAMSVTESLKIETTEKTTAASTRPSVEETHQREEVAMVTMEEPTTEESVVSNEQPAVTLDTESLKTEKTNESTDSTPAPPLEEETKHEDEIAVAATIEPVESKREQQSLLMTYLDSSKDSSKAIKENVKEEATAPSLQTGLANSPTSSSQLETSERGAVLESPTVAEKIPEVDGAAETLRQYLQAGAREQTRQRMNQRKQERSRNGQDTLGAVSKVEPKPSENGTKLPEFYAPPAADPVEAIAEPVKTKTRNRIIPSLSKTKTTILVGAVAFAVARRVVSVMIGRGML